MKVPEFEHYCHFISAPQASLDQLLLALLEVLRETFLELLLKDPIYLRYELGIKLTTAHRTCLITLDGLLLAGEAEQMIAGRPHWFGRDLKTYGALKVLLALWRRFLLRFLFHFNFLI
jgi:hypothetical protein